MRHTRHGWWLEEAGEVTPTRPLDGDAVADVVVVGGGYLGLWTAWQLLALEPETDVVVLEAAVCGHGPSGRNGGFCETLWCDATTLRKNAGDAAALAVCRASEDAVRGIGAWCETNDVDAWFREAPMLRVATTESQVGSWEGIVEAAAALGAPDEVLSVSATEVRARAGRVQAGSAVLAVNSAAAGFPGYRLSLAVASSHIVLTEPVPDVLDELGWTGGEAIVDSRTLVHYTRTTRDGRIVFGWGGGAMGYGGRASDRLELAPDVIAETEQALVRFFPQVRGRAVTHAWGGAIDVSPSHLPLFGSRGRVHHGFGFTGNGVGPSYLGGEILARLALDRRDERTSLAIVEPGRKLFPPEPFRYAGGSLIRRALLAKDAAEDDGRKPGTATRFVASLPRRLGLHLPR